MTGLDLKIKRLRAGKKQYEVAAHLGVCQTVLCEIEGGKRKLSPKLRDRIFAYLEKEHATVNLD